MASKKKASKKRQSPLTAEQKSLVTDIHEWLEDMCTVGNREIVSEPQEVAIDIASGNGPPKYKYLFIGELVSTDTLLKDIETFVRARVKTT